MIDALARLLKKELQAELSVILSRNAATKTAEKVSVELAGKVYDFVNRKLHGAISLPETEAEEEIKQEEPLL